MSDSEEFLEHFGIKGMKWGVTRKEGADGNVGSNPKNKNTDRDSGPTKKAKLKTARKEVYREAGALLGANKKKAVGAAVVGGLLGGPGGALGVGSAAVMRSQGHGRGKSAVLGYLGGPVGGLIVAEISARKRVAAG